MALYAFDGTWNSATLADNVEQENETNVANFCEAYADENKWYVPGPGTRFGNVGRVLGGATGLGGLMRVREAYSQLCKDWQAGPQDYRHRWLQPGGGACPRFRQQDRR